jgi:hypothetical protein
MIDIVLLDNIITTLGYYLDAFVIPLATAIVGFKLVQEKRQAGKFNPIRMIIFLIFLSFSALGIIEFLVSVPPLELTLLDEWFGGGIDNFDIYGFIIGTMVSLGVTMVFYAYRWESLYYFMGFIYGGMFIFYLLTGYDAWLETYITLGGLLGIIFLYFTAFRVKDNGALGLAIFFTIAFATLSIDFGVDVVNHWVTQISILVYSVFILIFSLGLFKPFKEVQN